MKIQGESLLDAPRQSVWNALLDPEVLARTLPGCEELVPVGEDEYEMKMKLAMASVSGLFSGKVRLADKTPMECYTLHLDARGKIGFVKGLGRFYLSDSGFSESGDATTRIRYEGDVQVGGMIASVGQRLMDMTSKMMIKKFFTGLATELGDARKP